MTRDEWRRACEAELEKPYVWGGEGPDAYDCSGFVQFALAKLNLDPPGDQTAAGLHRFFNRGRGSEVTLAGAELGDLVFFGKEDVTHVALAWGGGDMLEAGGGGSRTTSIAIARRQGAKVRIRPIASRTDLIQVLRPSALDWGIMETVVEAASLETTINWGRYENAPPASEWLEDGRTMRLTQPFGYVRPNGHSWPVSVGAIVDGASIPRVFWTLIGGPLEGRYRYASIVHDYYCDRQTRPWQDTHRVFYEAMICSGISRQLAKVMYYAVYRFGPRWTQGPSAQADGFGESAAPVSVPSALPVEAFDSASFQEDASRIQADDPDLELIEKLADARGFGAMLEGNASVHSLSALADAAMARRPLLQRLVDLQDAAMDEASAQAAGALLGRLSLEQRAGVGTGELEAPAPTFDQLKPKYESLYASCQVRPERKGEVAWHVRKLLQHRPRYETVSARTGTPWWFIGVVHALEASFNFQGHLHNGDSLSGRTVQVPKGRPAVWNPPNDWESSAVDAITFDRLAGLADWNLAQVLYRWERFNGFGYYPRNINSPYLWSYTNHYVKGKFVQDGVFDSDSVSKQCGAAAILRALEDAGVVQLR